MNTADDLLRQLRGRRQNSPLVEAHLSDELVLVFRRFTYSDLVLFNKMGEETRIPFFLHKLCIEPRFTEEQAQEFMELLNIGEITKLTEAMSSAMTSL